MLTPAKLTRERKALNLSQTEIGIAAKMGRFPVSQFELGYRKLTKDESAKIEKFIAKKKAKKGN